MKVSYDDKMRACEQDKTLTLARLEEELKQSELERDRLEKRIDLV